MASVAVLELISSNRRRRRRRPTFHRCCHGSTRVGVEVEVGVEVGVEITRSRGRLAIRLADDLAGRSAYRFSLAGWGRDGRAPPTKDQDPRTRGTVRRRLIGPRYDFLFIMEGKLSFCHARPPRCCNAAMQQCSSPVSRRYY